MEITMSFNDWVSEYQPIEGDSFIYRIRWLSDDPEGNEVIKKAKDLIGKYLIKSPKNTHDLNDEDADQGEIELVYPIDHISMVYLESATNKSLFWYVVTRKPMNVDKIIIEEKIDDRHTMKLYKCIYQNFMRFD